MKKKSFIRVTILLMVLALLAVAATSIMAAVQGYFPFMPKVQDAAWQETDYAVSAADVGGLVLDAPAGKYGYVVTQGDQFVLEDTGERIKFWGVNMGFGANFPATQQRAAELADDFASMGINLVRLHGFDSPNGAEASIFQNYTNNTQQLSPSQLDKLDYFIYELKQRGIYVNLNLNCKRVFVAGDGVDSPKKVSAGEEWKSIQLVDDQLIALQKQYAQQLLSHVNPYTGVSYAQEPAIAMIELENENSLYRYWYSGGLDNLNAHYSGVMKQKWNNWLAAKYGNDWALAEAWGMIPSSANMLQNPGFEQEDLSMYVLDANNKAVGSFIRDTEFATEGKASAKITVTNGGAHQNYVAFYQKGLQIEMGKSYEVSFDAKATTNWPISAYIRRPSGNMMSYGVGRFTITDTLQRYAFTITASASDNAVAFYVRMGTVVGDFWFDNLSVREVVEEEGVEELPYHIGAVDWILKRNMAEYPEAAVLDFSEFMRDTEKNTLNELRRYLREDLGARQPVSGNNLYSGLADLSAQADMDFTSGHAYFDHPVFSIPWLPDRFTLTNASMIASGRPEANPKTSMAGVLSFTAVEGKPFVAGEWNHAFPNPYEYESLIPMAAMASIQDWDAMILFAYSHYDVEDNSGAINGWLDIKDNPVKRAQMGTASLLFLKGYIPPAAQRLTMNYTQDYTMYYGLLNPATASFFSDAELPPSLLVDTIFRRDSFDADATTSIINAYTPEQLQNIQTRRVSQSTDGQFVWDVSASGAEHISIDTPYLQSFAGFIAGTQQQAENLTVSLGPDSNAAISLAALDGTELEVSDRMLLTVCGKQKNDGQRWFIGKFTWGSAPVHMQKLEGNIGVALAQPTSYTVYPLAGDGTRMPPLQTTVQDGKLQFALDADTVWYEIVR